MWIKNWLSLKISWEYFSPLPPIGHKMEHFRFAFLCCKYVWHLASNRRGRTIMFHVCGRPCRPHSPASHLQKELLPPQPWELVTQPSDWISTSSEGGASSSAAQSCSSLLISSRRLSLSESKMHVLLDPETPLLEIHPTTRLAHMQNGIVYKVLHYNSAWKPPQ